MENDEQGRNMMRELEAGELKLFIEQNQHIVIYGAGVLGQALYCLVREWKLTKHIDGFAVSEGVQHLDCFMGQEIKCISQYDLKRHIFMIAAKWMFAAKIEKNLMGAQYVYVGGNAMKKAFSCGVQGIDNMTMAALNRSDLSDTEYVSACVRQVRRERLGFEVNLVDHCNLNCQSCNHFSPIAEQYFLPIEKFEQDMKRIHELTDGELERIWLIGGEPLLHPDICEFMKIFRKYFPRVPMKLDTNGTLLLKQSDEFWRTVKETEAEIVLTKYPIRVDYDAIDSKMQKENVKYSYSVVSTDTVKTTYHLPLVENGNMEPVMNYLKCWHANECVTLRDGRIYPCPIAAHAHYFNERFGKNLYVGEMNSISIYDAKDIKEVFDFLKRPIPFCRHCNIRGYTFDLPWGISKREIEEWT